MSTRMYEEREILCFKGGALEPCRDKIALEEALALYVNGSLEGVFHCSPGLYEEFTLGFLVSSGFKVLQPYSISHGVGRLDFTGRLARLETTRPGRVEFRLGDVKRALDFLVEKGVAFKETGALHGAACFSQQGEILAHVEDVSRHCAIDKCIGLLVKSRHDLRKVGFAVTCRVTETIVEKLSRVGTPLIASKAAPTLQGVVSAENAGITLIGFMRGDRFNVYSHPERIIF